MLKYCKPLFVLLTLYSFISCNSTKKNTPPNVILINIDDLGWADLGFMGSTYYQTPHIDQLAKEGMVFTNGYAGAANCAPSRACLLTGQQTTRHGIYTVGNSDRGDAKTRKIIPTPNTKSISDSSLTLAHLFKKANYTTATFGKWHLSKDPLLNGFDYNIAGDHRGNPGHKGYFAPYNNLPNIKEAPDGEQLTDRITQEVISFLKKQDQKPFFVYLPYYTVHTPIMGKPSLIKKYKQIKGNDKHNNPKYAAMIENMDHNIGKIMHTLDDLKLNENTLIIFTSDNGGIRDISSQFPLRAGKGSYYEGGIRVPYIFKWTTKIKPNTKNEVLISNLDIFPTIKDMLEVDTPKTPLDGTNIMPLLKGGSIAERALIWHFPIYLQAYNPNNDQGRDPLFRTRPGTAIRWKQWKLLQYFEDNTIELYNLQTDLGEQHNIVEDHPDVKKLLLDKIKTWQLENNAPIPTQLNPKYDSVHHHQLIKNYQNYTH